MPLTGIYDASFVLTSVLLGHPGDAKKLSICCRTGVMVAEGRPHTFVQKQMLWGAWSRSDGQQVQ
jgi:hypothetical protein